MNKVKMHFFTEFTFFQVIILHCTEKRVHRSKRASGVTSKLLLLPPLIKSPHHYFTSPESRSPVAVITWELCNKILKLHPGTHIEIIQIVQDEAHPIQ